MWEALLELEEEGVLPGFAQEEALLALAKVGASVPFCLGEVWRVLQAPI